MATRLWYVSRGFYNFIVIFTQKHSGKKRKKEKIMEISFFENWNSKQ